MTASFDARFRITKTSAAENLWNNSTPPAGLTDGNRAAGLPESRGGAAP